MLHKNYYIEQEKQEKLLNSQIDREEVLKKTVVGGATC